MERPPVFICHNVKPNEVRTSLGMSATARGACNRFSSAVRAYAKRRVHLPRADAADKEPTPAGSLSEMATD